MDIVVKLPDKDYQVMLTKVMLACYGCEIIELSKGHGNLIDADELFLDIQTDEQMRLGEHLAWVKERIDNAPTIIEKEDEVES